MTRTAPVGAIVEDDGYDPKLGNHIAINNIAVNNIAVNAIQLAPDALE